MSILLHVVTPSCTSHTDCLITVEVGIACECAKPHLNAYTCATDEEKKALTEGTPIAREIETYTTQDYNMPTYVARAGWSHPIRYDAATVAKLNAGEHPYLSAWSDSYPIVTAQREILTYESYVGCVVATRTSVSPAHWDSGHCDTHNYHATVLTSDGTFKEIHVSSSNFDCPTWNRSDIEVDAPPAVMARYQAEVKAAAERQALADAQRAAERAAEAAEEEANTPRKGRMIRVVRGRKVPIGTSGEVVWYGATKFGHSVRIKQASGKEIWVSARNVEVIRNDVSAAAE